MKPLKNEKAFQGPTLSRAELRELITTRLDGKLSEHLSLQMADFRYYLPRYDEAKEIIDNSKMIQLAGPFDAKTRGERFDCDDFSLLLKARFAYAAYRNRGRYQNNPHCFGIVWGMLPFPFPHSMNWMVTADREFYFIEPQRQKILTLDKCKGFRHINFMLV
ncbi:MAG: hypothetical protein GY697_23945 [Desulfobacterales bacterium]|nr:hypothetical protein [Desulfobacterales bacterium]